MDAKHKATRRGEGEYLYRGFTIVDHGGGRSVHAAIMRSGNRWLVRKITGNGYFDSVAMPLSASTLKAAKARIDYYLGKAAVPLPELPA